MFYLGIFSSIVLTFIYWAKKNNIRGFFLFWYIVFLPTSKLLPDINIPGFRFEILFGLCFLVADYLNQDLKSIKGKLLFKQSKYARIFIVLQAVYLIYDALKFVLFPEGDNFSTAQDFLIFTVRTTLIVVIFIRICYLLQNRSVRKI
ncbi:MAG: hypothetical protein ABI550_06430, partial [Ignavibacteriaceae bacterium]